MLTKDELSKYGLVLMASGFSKRFGEDKLTYIFQGKPLYRYSFDQIPEGLEVLVVSNNKSILKEAKEKGFFVKENDLAEEGISASIKVGVDFFSLKEALVFLVCDQPYLKKESVEKLLALHLEYPDHILCLCCGELLGNPCLFPGSYFSELSALKGDRGGKAVILSHQDKILKIPVLEEELKDIDFKEDLVFCPSKIRR